MDNYGDWITLKEEVKRCKGCELCSSQRVLDKGNRDARIMIVGDKPTVNVKGEAEVLSKDALTYVEETLALFDIDPKSVYITNLVNCAAPLYQRIKKSDLEACIKCLRKQFSLVKPEIVLCLGTLAAKTLIDKNFNLAENHGNPINKGKVMFMATFHPNSFGYDTDNRDAFLSDITELYKFCKTYPPYSK